MLKLFLAIFCFFVVTAAFFYATNDAQKEPYMDEEFHVPQAQQYCNSNFTAWDPMITTLPGLYLVSLPLLYPVALVFGGGDLSSVCTVSTLRGLNIVFSVGNLYLLYLITHTLHFRRKNTSEVVLTAVALATFPILYFFNFLYYTDPAAIFFALLSYYFTLSAKHLTAAVIGVFAIICRQTNVVWVVFGTGLTIGRSLMQWIQLDKKHADTKEKRLSDWSVLSKTLSLIGGSMQHNPKELVHLAVEIMKTVWSYAVVGMGFAAFVVINEGIVVGDRTNHQPCLNFPQLFYFLFITTFFSFMHMVSVRKVQDFLRYVITNPVKTATFLLLAVLFISKFMFIHEYNLADNRHYNFYFLSKIIRRNQYSKFILIPGYYYAFVTFWNLLENRDIFWKLSFLICTAATIVPQRLVEFRYFIMPYFIFRLNMPMPSKLFLLTEIAFYFAINCLTVYMYSHKPFPWADKNAPQRFMW